MIDLSQIRFRTEQGTLLTEIHAAVLLTNSATISNDVIKNTKTPQELFDTASEGLKQALWEHCYGELREAWLALKDPDGGSTKEQFTAHLDKLLTPP